MKLLIVILLVCLLLLDVQAWFWRRKSSSCGSHKRLGKPYYFGKTILICMLLSKKGKRAPTRNTLSMSHGWIYYDGLYYEFGIGSAHTYHVATKPVKGRECKADREGRPAGYGVISKECLKRCAQRYRSKYGRYNLLTNNCHKFANRMSHILCKYNHCPKWCS